MGNTMDSLKFIYSYNLDVGQSLAIFLLSGIFIELAFEVILEEKNAYIKQV